MFVNLESTFPQNNVFLTSIFLEGIFFLQALSSIRKAGKVAFLLPCQQKVMPAQYSSLVLLFVFQSLPSSYFALRVFYSNRQSNARSLSLSKCKSLSCPLPCLRQSSQQLSLYCRQLCSFRSFLASFSSAASSPAAAIVRLACVVASAAGLS